MQLSGFLVATAASCLIAAHVSAAPPSDDYVLKFEDNFNGSALNTDEWNYRTGSRFFGNNKPENVTITTDPQDSAKKVLKLQFKKETNVEANGGVPFSNAGIISKRLLGFGYYEISAKIYAHSGLHTSFWNMGLSDLGFNNQINEIDMFEIDGHSPTILGSNLHNYVPSHFLPYPNATVHTIADSSQAYHVYGFEWLPDKVRWYVDGLMIRESNYAGPHGLQNLWLTAQQLTYDPSGVDLSTMDANGVLGASYFDYFRYYQTPSDYKADVMQAPYNAILVNNDSPKYSESSGDWISSDLAFGYQDRDTREAVNSNSWAKWTPGLSQSGKYEVFAWNPSYNQNSLKNAHYTVVYKGASMDIYVDQSTAGQNWVSLGIYDFTTDANNYVKAAKDATSPAAETLRTDAVMFVPVSSYIDENSSNYSESGTWTNSTEFIGADGSTTRWNSTNGSAKWSPNLAASGWHDVYVWLPVHLSSSNKAKYTISHNSVTDTVYVNQTQGSSRWVKLGSFDFMAGAGDYVKVENGNSDPANIRTDAIKFFPLAAQDLTAPTIPSADIMVTPESDPTLGRYNLIFSWTPNSESDLAGYHVYLSGIKLTRTPIQQTSYKIFKGQAQTNYNLAITAVDYSGNESAPRTFTGTTDMDTTAPSAPSGLTAESAGSGNIHLKIGTRSQGEDVAGYNYYMNGVKVNSLPAGTPYVVTGLTNGTAHTFEVAGVDRAGNESFKSSAVKAVPINQTVVAYGDLRYRDIEVTGTWIGSSLTPFIGNTVYTNETGASLTWKPRVTSGAYEVFAWVAKTSNASTAARYTIHTSAAASSDIVISQNGTGASWVSLGSYNFSGSDVSVTLENAANSGFIRANAIKLVPLEIDSGDVQSRYTETGAWSDDTAVTGWQGSATRKSNSSGALASWTPSSLANGYYEIYAWLPTASDGTVSAKYTIYHNGKSDVVTKNQSTGGNQWIRIGSYDFDGGGAEYVTLENGAGSGTVRADALKLMALPPAIVIDNGAEGYTELSGTWNNSGLQGYGGSATRYSGTTGATVKWQPTLSQAGTYKVYLYKVHAASNPDTSSDPNAKITIYHGGVTDTQYVDFTTGATGFVELGEYYFDAGSTGFVQNTLNTAGCNIRADAVIFQLIYGN